MTEQPKANAEVEGKNEEEGAAGEEGEEGEEGEDGEADAEDSDGESEEEEEGGCCSFCNKASSPIFILIKYSLKNLYQPLIGSCTLCCCLAAVCAVLAKGKKGAKCVPFGFSDLIFLLLCARERGISGDEGSDGSEGEREGREGKERKEAVKCI